MKNCKSNSERLSALADGELGGIAAWWLRRHVAVCKECAKVRAEWENLNTALRSDLMPDPRFDPPFAEARAVVSSSRWGSRRRLAPKVALAGLGAVVAAGLFYSEPRNHDSPMAAHASVVRAMSDVRTATWQADTTIFNSKSGKVYSEIRQVNKARLDPPSLLWTTQTLYKTDAKAFPWDSGSVRLDTKSWSNYSAGVRPGSISVDHKVEKYLANPLSDRETRYQRVRRQVFDAIFRIISPDERRLSASSAKPDQYGFTRKTMTPTTSLLITRNGRREFRISESMRLLPGHLEFQNTVWADAQSFWIDEAEEKVIDVRTGRTRVHTHLSHFRYNRPLTDADMAIDVAPGTSMYSDGKRVQRLP